MREEIMALNATPAAPWTRARAGSYSGPPLIRNGLFSFLSLTLCTCRCTAALIVLIDSCLAPQTCCFYYLSRLCYLGSWHFRHRASVCVCVFTLSRSSLSRCLLLLSRSILLHSSSISGHGGRPCSCCSRHLSTWTHGRGFLVSRVQTASRNLLAPNGARKTQNWSEVIASTDIWLSVRGCGDAVAAGAPLLISAHAVKAALFLTRGKKVVRRNAQTGRARKTKGKKGRKLQTMFQKQQLNGSFNYTERDGEGKRLLQHLSATILPVAQCYEDSPGGCKNMQPG